MRTVAPALASLLLSACVHEVAPPDDSEAPLFVAEGDALIDALDPQDGFGVTPALRTPAGFTRVGLRFDAEGPVLAEVRVSNDGAQSFGPWRASTLTFHEGTANNAQLDVGSAGTTHLQVRFAAPVESGLSFLAIEAFVPAEEREVQLNTATQGLAADGIALPREAWGARARSCNSPMAPSRITVHHTETPTNDSLSVAARVRQVQNYHIDVRGWCDIGYHFLVGRDGNVYQGRRENTLGAHVGGANADNVGIALVGSFMSQAAPELMEAALARIVGAVARGYGIAVDRAHIKGHRELGDTDCPGDALFARLPALVQRVRDDGAGSGDDAGGGSSDDGGDAACAQVAVVGAGTLNVRPEPNTSRAPLDTLSDGDVVDVVDVVDDGQSVRGIRTWYRIATDDLQGFISGAYAQCQADAGPTPPPASDDVYGGLNRGTARIPRSGIANDTLENALGPDTEPFGTVVSNDGHDWVRGRVSSFGGPNDTGVGVNETGAVTGERLRGLNSPENASAGTIASRPADFYFAAMRWDYTPHGVSFWRGTSGRILVKNPANGHQVVLRAVDWGPNTSTARILDLSPQAMRDLGASTDDQLLVAFAAEGAGLGVH